MHTNCHRFPEETCISVYDTLAFKSEYAVFTWIDDIHCHLIYIFEYWKLLRKTTCFDNLRCIGDGYIKIKTITNTAILICYCYQTILLTQQATTQRIS